MSAEEINEEEDEVSAEDLKLRLIRMIYNQPDILFHIFEVLFELLEARGVMNEGEAEVLISEAVKRWRGESEEIQ